MLEGYDLSHPSYIIVVGAVSGIIYKIWRYKVRSWKIIIENIAFSTLVCYFVIPHLRDYLELGDVLTFVTSFVSNQSPKSHL